MKQPDTAELMLHDVVTELIEMARAAKTQARQTGDALEIGRKLALYEVVSLIQLQALAFGLPLDRIGLDGLDVDNELL